MSMNTSASLYCPDTQMTTSRDLTPPAFCSTSPQAAIERKASHGQCGSILSQQFKILLRSTKCCGPSYYSVLNKTSAQPINGGGGSDSGPGSTWRRCLVLSCRRCAFKAMRAFRAAISACRLRVSSFTNATQATTMHLRLSKSPTFTTHPTAVAACVAQTCFGSRYVPKTKITNVDAAIVPPTNTSTSLWLVQTIQSGTGCGSFSSGLWILKVALGNPGGSPSAPSGVAVFCRDLRTKAGSISCGGFGGTAGGFARLTIASSSMPVTPPRFARTIACAGGGPCGGVGWKVPCGRFGGGRG